MHLLWIAIVLALLKGNYGEDKTTVARNLIKELSNLNTTIEKKASGSSTSENSNGSKNGTDLCGGVCITYYRCVNGTTIRSGDGYFAIKIGSADDLEKERHSCPSFFDICCPGERKNTFVVPFGYVLKRRPDECGVRTKNTVVNNLIERGNGAQFAEFPWVVAIFHATRDENDAMVKKYKCGGSLIHPGVVITAAHCVVDIHNILIRAGEWDTQTTNEPFPHQERFVVDVLIHDQYTRGTHFNNIALLFLNEPVELAENVNTVCLPPQDFVFDNQRCFANGWGKDKFGREGFYQVILKRIELPVIPRDECQSKLRSTRLGKYFQLDPSFICAGGESGKDTCTGDGGAPLNCEIPNTERQYYLAGEVSWGVGCFDPIPSVYVNIAKFRHFIDKVFDERKLEQKYYIEKSVY